MFKISVDSVPLTKELLALGKTMPAKLARGINFAIFDAKETVQRQAGDYIDEPTPYTRAAIFSTRATAENLFARVGYKNFVGGRGSSPEYYMHQLTTGGGRNPKRLETKLKAMGVMAPGQWSVFGKAGKDRYGDKYGNLAPGSYHTMLAALASGNRTKKGRSRKPSEKRPQFWKATKNGQPSGVMFRWGKGKDDLGYFLKFVDDVSYAKQYPFIPLMRQEFDRLIERALYRAIVLSK